MPPKKATAAVQDVATKDPTKDPATFDVAGWLAQMSEQGFKPRNVTVKLHLRGDLLPRINELIEEIQTASDIDREVGVNDSDPIGDKVAEYERLSAEFEEAGHLDFVFRPMTRSMHNRTFREWEDRHPSTGRSEEDWDELALTRICATCVDFPLKGVVGDELTVDALRAFEATYGTPAFNTLVAGWREAYEAGGEVAAPFSPKPSHTPDTAGSSST